MEHACMYGQWALKPFNVELWVADTGMPVRSIVGHDNRNPYFPYYQVTDNHLTGDNSIR